MEFVSSAEELAEFVAVHSELSASSDPKDNVFLSLAVDGRADLIVSGDKRHLLPFEPLPGHSDYPPGGFPLNGGGGLSLGACSYPILAGVSCRPVTRSSGPNTSMTGPPTKTRDLRSLPSRAIPTPKFANPTNEKPLISLINQGLYW